MRIYMQEMVRNSLRFGSECRILRAWDRQWRNPSIIRGCCRQGSVRFRHTILEGHCSRAFVSIMNLIVLTLCEGGIFQIAVALIV